MPDRVLLLLPTTSYKARDFLDAADRLGVDVVVGTDRRQALDPEAPGHALALDFARPARGLARIVEAAAAAPFRAVIGTDDESAILAALAAEALGLRHNPVDAVRRARDKHLSRRATAQAGMRTPRFLRFRVADGPGCAAAETRFPCVLKPLGLAGSRGVIRADDRPAFDAAWRRIAALLARPDVRSGGTDCEHLLVEDYLDGAEYTVEGLLERGTLHALALFEKPDPLAGPTFPESMFVTPARVPDAQRAALVEEARRACGALGLVEGPVHVELRWCADEPWLLEVAPRTIGGLCSRSLRFGTGRSLEELILGHALGVGPRDLERERPASGVLMIPVERAGVLREVLGVEEARAEPGVQEVSLTLARGTSLEPLPEGHHSLGFIFARGKSPDAVERALRRARSRLTFVIDP